MKILYISPWDMDLKGRFNGSAKKVLSFVKVMNELGYETTLYNKYKPMKDNLISKFISRLPYAAVFNQLEYSAQLDGYDAYYIRFYGSDYPFRKFLKKLRKANMNSKILIEFPDTDYMTHFSKSIKNIPFFLKDFRMKSTLKKYVDRVVLLGLDESFYNIKCINVFNGIDVETIAIKEHISTNAIHFGSIASLQPVHGVDLFIKGLSKYYENEGNRDIILDIIGGGEILAQLKKLATDLGIINRIIFHGYKFGEELDHLYDYIDIGLCELAPFRRGYTLSSSLKSREYMAKGLPMITAVDIDFLQGKELEFVLKLEPNPNYVSIEKCVEFYDAMYHGQDSNQRLIHKIRSYASKKLDIRVTVKPILNYLEEE